MIVSNNQDATNSHVVTISSPEAGGREWAASLEQNIPNPFANTTVIGYTLPQKFTSAQIVITDKSGKILKAANISGTGKGSLTVDASTLASGAYQYSLIDDGKLVDTKQMIVN